MPIYSETISDEQLLRLVSEKEKKVFVIGCGMCMNEALAFKHNIPITKSLGSDVYEPNATLEELKRIETLLKLNGFDAKVWCPNKDNDFLCTRDINKKLYPELSEEIPDIIMALSCGAGFDAICDTYANIKVIKIAKETGFLFYSFQDKENVRSICKEKSRLMSLLRNLCGEE